MTEAIELKWSNVNLDKRLIFVEHTKSHKTRSIPIPDALGKMLLRLPKRSLNVFGHEDGGPWSRRGVEDAFERAVRRAGIINFTFHDLRHSFSLNYLLAHENANAIYDLKKLLGHSSLTTTQRYLSALDQNLRQGMEGVSNKLGEKVWGKVWGKLNIESSTELDSAKMVEY